MGKNSELHHDPLGEKSFQMAVRIVKLCKYLRKEKKEYIISKQVLRSGTNPGAMVCEAQNAESGADFIHKLAVGLKEAAETLFWLRLLYTTDYINQNEYLSLKSDIEEVVKLIKSSIKTKKRNMGLKAITILVIIASAISVFLN